jgi:hypothetical protein
MKCEMCGNVLGKEPFMVSVNLLNTEIDFQKTIEAPVCDEVCAKKYMLKVRSTLIVGNLKVDEVS